MIRSEIAVTEVTRTRSGEDEVSEGKAIEAAIVSEVRVTEVGSFFARVEQFKTIEEAQN